MAFKIISFTARKVPNPANARDLRGRSVLKFLKNRQKIVRNGDTTRVNCSTVFEINEKRVAHSDVRRKHETHYYRHTTSVLVNY